jgi:hypothetical protein
MTRDLSAKYAYFPMEVPLQHDASSVAWNWAFSWRSEKRERTGCLALGQRIVERRRQYLPGTWNR